MKAGVKVPVTVDEYLEGIVKDDMRSLLEKVRNTIRSAAPKAEEIISYRMPAYKQDGVLVYFAAFKNHCSLFPASKQVIDEFEEELALFKTSKGTIQFTVDHPLPLGLIKKIVKARVAENKVKTEKKKR